MNYIRINTLKEHISKSLLYEYTVKFWTLGNPSNDVKFFATGRIFDQGLSKTLLILLMGSEIRSYYPP